MFYSACHTNYRRENQIGFYCLANVTNNKQDTFIVTFSYVMEQHALKNVNNCLNANIYSYLETSGGQSFNPYLNVVHFFNTSVNWASVAA